MAYEPNRKIWTSFIKRNADIDLSCQAMWDKEVQVKRFLRAPSQSPDLFCVDISDLLGEDRLDFIKKLGVLAEASDKCRIQECMTDEDEHAWYWTRTDDRGGDAYIVGDRGRKWHESVKFRSVACRPAAYLSQIQSIYAYAGEVSICRESNGVLSFYLGHDWTDLVAAPIRQKLEDMYSCGQLKQSEKFFTSDEIYWKESEKPFIPKKENVYEYEEEFYVRHCIDTSSAYRFRNAYRYKKGDVAWFKVVPQLWYYDEKKDICMMAKVPFAGVRFHYERIYETENFNQSEMKRYLDKYYSYEIMQFTGDSGPPRCLRVEHIAEVKLSSLDIGDCVVFGKEIFFVTEITPSAIRFTNALEENLELKCISNRHCMKAIFDEALELKQNTN